MIFRTVAFPLHAILYPIFQMKSLKHILLAALLISVSFSCDDQTNDGFPKARFTGIFDINDPRWSGNSFSATTDMNHQPVGLAGIIVYRASATEYYAFERMCPYEKQFSCRVLLNEDDDIAECECCGSQFLITEYSEIVEGPSGQLLKKYSTYVSGNNRLVVSAP